MSDLVSSANDDQARASNPEVSAWVSANAGSGKTHVLVNRVIRLMLTGTPPEKILCLTYTRAAAAEMSNRLYERLAEWIPLDDEALIDKIHENTGHTRFSSEQLAAPRRLFARALETPGGLKIQTIHAFCEQLLHRFPIEAGVTSGFAVMDDRQATDLLSKIRSDFLTETEQAGDKKRLAHLAEVIKFCGGLDTFDGLLERLLSNRDNLISVYQGLDAASTRLALALGINRGDTVETIIASVMDGVDGSALIEAQSTLASRTTKIDKDQAVLLDRILRSGSNSQILEFLKLLTMKAGDKPKADSRLCTKSCSSDNPEVFANLQKLVTHTLNIIDKIRAVSVLHATIAALNIGKIITCKYDAEKNRLGFYDYHDLIAKVLSMFATMPDAAWVLYKLDGGLDHILIDEAQDTSPAQWDIIQFLADEFFSGAGGRPDVIRSIFAVGDRKQSIYSFQGAAPESFDQRKAHFAQASKDSGQIFETVDFDVSFRSTKQVLNLVDQVFDQSIASRGVDNTTHQAQRAEAPGIVELWPLEEKSKTEKQSIWIPDNNKTTDDHTRIRLAKKIALKIKSWLDSREILQSENRPIQPGDILILVRRRTQLMAALVRALKQLDIPVAGVDRLKLTRHIGVQDLMALARFVLLPQDDLNFAGLLKSSLLEKDDGKPFDDDDLLSISANRGSSSVWNSFLEITSKRSDYSKTRQDLETWQKKSQHLLPFEFFSSVLSVDKKRTSVLKRLGSEASEPLDAFLMLALEFEKTNVPTLQGFLLWVSHGDSEIKREMEKNDNEVRIMTVHGAKGLEAKIVILPDTYEVPDGKNIPKFLDADEITPVWRLKSAFETSLTDKLKQQHLSETEEELNRLLYVALTRARDRLYIGAAEPNSRIKDHSWYQLVSNVLRQPENEASDLIFGNVWRIAGGFEIENKDKQSRPQADKPAPLPAWAFSNARKEKQGTEWIAPSKLGLDTSENNERFISPLASLLENRFVRGNLIHKMLQYLPGIDPALRDQVAKRYIQTHDHLLPEQELKETLEETLAILSDPLFSPVFAPGSIAEAPIVARIKSKSGKNLIINGQIDRLNISDGQILIVDYKTNRPPPSSPMAVNPQYIRQLAAYRLALLEIYPDHTIQTGLLWTHSATLMEIDEKQLIAFFSS